MPNFFEPLELGPTTIKNRSALAAMTRERCGLDGVPTEMHAKYFAQRAGAGLLVTGNNWISPQGASSLSGPGLYNDEQVEGWSHVTKAVHDVGGHIFGRIFHAGPARHTKTRPDGLYPIAASAVPWGADCRTPDGKVPCLPPRPLEAEEMPALVAEYAAAARNAIKAGFDGVEIHSCSGYLLESFLLSRPNQRTDGYGGSPANRCRLLFEIFEGVAAAIGNKRVGVKISPEHNRNNVYVDDNPQELYSHLVEGLSELEPAYVHVADNALNFDYHALLRPKFKGTYFAGVGFTPERAKSYVEDGKADVVMFGRLFISNPDLAQRIRAGAKLNPLDPATIYTAGPRGLLDYPMMEIGAEPVKDSRDDPPPVVKT